MDFTKYVYEKFFMRDLLGKLTPGFLTIASLLIVLGREQEVIDIVKDEKWKWGYWIFILPVFHLTGLGLQIIFELLGFHHTGPRAFPVYSSFLSKNLDGCGSIKAMLEAKNDYRIRQVLIAANKDNKWTKEAEGQRERFIYLREGSGNLAWSCGLLFIALIIRNGNWDIRPEVMSIGILSVVLWISH